MSNLFIKSMRFFSTICLRFISSTSPLIINFNTDSNSGKCVSCTSSKSFSMAAKLTPCSCFVNGRKYAAYSSFFSACLSRPSFPVSCSGGFLSGVGSSGLFFVNCSVSASFCSLISASSSSVNCGASMLSRNQLIAISLTGIFPPFTASIQSRRFLSVL